ncbi:MAG: hypothetical protein L6422_04095 [Candidatus Marinimicrobia bacterium]|nr:hypothetical protein [bacterium]MCG2715460.1 hypothetical protein [Candidatus Neomarinimicrobiota bacterium]
MENQSNLLTGEGNNHKVSLAKLNMIRPGLYKKLITNFTFLRLAAAGQAVEYTQILFNVNDHQLLATIPIFGKYVLKSMPFPIIFGKTCWFTKRVCLYLTEHEN